MSGSVGNNPYRASGVVASLSAGREGTVDWDTTIHTSTVTAESGKGYFVNTTGGAVTVNLPAASVGDIVGIKDYAGTFQTNACTVAPNGSQNIGGASANDPTLEVEGEAILLVYADATQGWLATQQSVTASPTGAENFVTATGGNQPTAGGCVVDTNYKIHKFTGPGTFCVSAIGCAANNVVSYLVVAGGGGGGSVPNVNSGGPGGGGGFREYKSSVDCYTASPLDGNPCGTAITVSASPYTIAVGGGGTTSTTTHGGQGSTSTFSTIDSAGGGRGGAMYPSSPTVVGGSGGSGGGTGGGRTGDAGGTGNSPPTTPPQGQNGGPNAPTGADNSSGGGGGAGGAGGTSGGTTGGTGGAHVNTSISGADVEYSGGSGGAGHPGAAGTPGAGGAGQAKSPTQSAAAGGCNTGGSGGGAFSGGSGGIGGSGIVYIRYKFQ
jgi:hypothetical protein